MTSIPVSPWTELASRSSSTHYGGSRSRPGSVTSQLVAHPVTEERRLPMISYVPRHGPPEYHRATGSAFCVNLRVSGMCPPVQRTDNNKVPICRHFSDDPAGPRRDHLRRDRSPGTISTVRRRSVLVSFNSPYGGANNQDRLGGVGAYAVCGRPPPRVRNSCYLAVTVISLNADRRLSRGWTTVAQPRRVSICTAMRPPGWSGCTVPCR